MPGQRGQGDVFATADQGIRLRQFAQFGTQGEVSRQGVGEAPPASPSWPQAAGRVVLVDGGMAGDGAFHQGQFAAAEAGTFAGGVVVGQAAGLPFVDGERLAVEAIAEGLAELHVGRQAEAAGQAFAGDLADPTAFAQAHGFQALLAEGGEHVAVGAVATGEQAGGLPQLAGPARQAYGEGGQGSRRRLFGDAQQAGPALAGAGGAGQQQRAGASHHQALAGQWQAALGQRLQAAGAGDAGEGPAGKRQQQFAGAGAEDQASVADLPATLRVFQQQAPAGTAGDHPGRREVLDIGVPGQALTHLMGTRRQVGTRAVAPDLSAGGRVVVDQGDARAARRGGQRCGQAGGAGADDQQVVVGAHACLHAHAGLADGLAGQASPTVDQYPAFLARAHAAERRAPPAADRAAGAAVAAEGEGGRHAGTDGDPQRTPVDEQFDHGRALPELERKRCGR